MTTERGWQADIVGRDAELASLDEFLLRPDGALLLHGGPGIGKTTLWAAGVAAARERGRHVLVAQPSEAEAHLGFLALNDLLEGVGDEHFAALPAPQRRALEAAVLRTDAPTRPPGPNAVSLGFLNTIRSLARASSILVAVDDVQWLDGASAEALSFAARRLDSSVGFLLTLRSGCGFPLERALAPRDVARLEVGPLSLGASRRLLFERCGLTLSRHALRRVFDLARGSPLFVLELGRSLAEHGPLEIGAELPLPDSVEELLGTRVDRLPPPLRRLLLAVALSAGVRATQLTALADPDALDDAVDEGLLVVEGDRVRAAHPLLAAAARARSRPSERRDLHLRLAEVVGDEELRLRHLALATEHPDEALAAALAASARRASERSAIRDAVELGEHALRLTPPDLPERAQRLLALGEYLLIAGETTRATDLVLPEVENQPAGSVRARAHLLLAQTRFRAAHVDEYGEALERALADSADDPTLHVAATARRSHYQAVVRVEGIREAESAAAAALRAARAAGPAAELDVLHALGWARVLRGRPIDDLCRRFRELGGDNGEILQSLERIAAERLAWRGDVVDARRRFARMLRQADDRGETRSYVKLQVQLCELALRTGDWRGAEPILGEWEHSGRDLLDPGGYERCRAHLEAGRGNADEAGRWAAQAIVLSESHGLRWNLLEALRASGVAALLVHDGARAVEQLLRVWDHLGREGVEEPGAFPVAPDLVEALVEVGEPTEAAVVSTRLAELAEEQDHAWGTATAARCQAVVRLGAGYDETAVRALERSAAAYRALGLHLDHARTLLTLGRALRRARRWGAARAALETAAAAFDSLGSSGWTDAAQAELGRLGGRRPAPSGGLTPTELKTAQLAADGLSNKEIASRLVVTVHTVETHLTRAYAKLGVRSRSQLERALKN